MSTIEPMTQMLVDAVTTMAAALGVAMLLLMAALPVFLEWEPPRER